MSLDLESRRPVRQMTRADFAAYPVWEWAINEEDTLGQDQSFLRPTSLDCVPALHGYYVVAASVTLSDGSVLPACVQVHVRARKPQCVPMFILMPDRHLDFAAQGSMTVLSHYTKVNDTKPVSWELAVAITGHPHPVRGTLRPSVLMRAFQFVRRLGMPSRLPGSPSSHLL